MTKNAPKTLFLDSLREHSHQSMKLEFSLLGEFLKTQRMKKGYSETYVAKKTGISRSTLRKIEKGESVKTETIECICEFYEISIRFSISLS